MSEQEKVIPKTYDEYMASGLVSKEWEAGFIAGKVHEVKRALAMVDMAMSIKESLDKQEEV